MASELYHQMTLVGGYPTTILVKAAQPIRVNKVRLLPNGSQSRGLHKIADTSVKLWNEIIYERRRQFFQQKKVNLREIWKKYYEKYKDILKVNTQAVLQGSVDFLSVNSLITSHFLGLSSTPHFSNPLVLAHTL